MNNIDEVLKKSEQPQNETGINLESETEKSFAKERLEGLKQDREERKKYARITFQFLCVFTGLVMMIIVFVGGSYRRFYLSDNVLITLITTSLSTVVGIFILVMR